jgi:DNA invertase Pin-like site-specific DNA recombinase
MLIISWAHGWTEWFHHLVTEVCLGKVGVVLMLEASRLARNNSDWYRLIEICGLVGTLIADESAVYNPREPNDRLLLGVNRTLSEAELSPCARGRMRDAGTRRAKSSRFFAVQRA